MKLNNKRTVLIGLAFLSICAFWQMYDNIIPLILTNTFHMDETISGVIMAADNVLALFLLPFFGALSDRTSTRIGRRMPFILFGTVWAVILMNVLPVIDNSFARENSAVKLVLFVVTLGLLLVMMGTYRSPAVALMPDVTPKPLRSKANAIINLMGAVGGIFYLAVAAVMYPNEKTAGLSHVDYQPLFIVVSALMAVSVLVLYLTIREPKLAEEERAYETAHPEQQLAEDDGSGNEVLPGEVKRSLAFLLVSISLWFIGYNAVTTWFTVYVGEVMGQGLGGASTCLLIATGGAIVSYLPIGAAASKIGRQKTIKGGACLLAACFLLGYFLTTRYTQINAVMFVVFALVGLAWAAINVNSLPMVVEMCKGSDIGKFTGYYYTFSMAAQVVTPVLSGWLLKHVGYTTLFPYAAFFVACSFVTMCFVRHGDSKVAAKKGIEAFADMDAD
ncbi:MAG: MFS transporter [Oscillospiraceae bacterium]|nr:MFS transporter [Oscillospiraceae bacterium]MDY5735490.1 MFS transporter [Oscillospiraceae bacterium]